MSVSQESAATIVCKEIFDGTSHPSDEGTWTSVNFHPLPSSSLFFFPLFPSSSLSPRSAPVLCLPSSLDRCSTGWFSSLATDCHPHFRLSPPPLSLTLSCSLSGSSILGHDDDDLVIAASLRGIFRLIARLPTTSPGSFAPAMNQTTKRLISSTKG